MDSRYLFRGKRLQNGEWVRDGWARQREEEAACALDAEVERAFNILYAKGFTPAQYRAAYEFYEKMMRKGGGDENAPI